MSEVSNLCVSLQGEWQGAFSDNSACWTADLKRKARHEVADDGSFWMQLSDFISNFDSVDACSTGHAATADSRVIWVLCRPCWNGCADRGRKLGQRSGAAISSSCVVSAILRAVVHRRELLEGLGVHPSFIQTRRSYSWCIQSADLNLCAVLPARQWLQNC